MSFVLINIQNPIHKKKEKVRVRIGAFFIFRITININMSNFLNTLKELHLVGILDKWQLQNYSKKYSNSSPENQAALDKHALMVLENSSRRKTNYYNNIRSIKNNLQFLAWISIIGLAIAVFIFIAEVSS